MSHQPESLKGVTADEVAAIADAFEEAEFSLEKLATIRHGCRDTPRARKGESQSN